MAFVQGYPTVAACETYISDAHVESVEENNYDYWNQWLQMHWRMLNMHESASALNVYADTTTTYKIAAGKYYYGGEYSDFAGSAAFNPTDNDTTYVWMEPGNVISDALVGAGWPTDKEHVKLAEVAVGATGLITGIVDRRPMLAIPTGSTQAGITTGGLHCKRIATTQLEALLSDTTSNLFAVKGGDMITEVVFTTKTAAGSGEVDIGMDAAAGGGADTDGWIDGIDLTVANKQWLSKSSDCDGAYAIEGGRVVAADGYVTITCTTDETGGTFVGGCYMYYIPGQ